MHPLRTSVNSYVSLAFVASFALFVAIMIWDMAEMENPIANAIFVSALAEEY